MGRDPREALNGIAPYFTAFPLEFPLKVLKEGAKRGDLVLDPFCGRGTTNFAARLLGLRSLGVDSNPVAVAITAAKLVTVSVPEILAEAERILARPRPRDIPQGEFWEWAFHPDVLDALCKFREAFLEDCSTPPRIALRGILLGALHGPKRKTPGYFSNQCPRTYAPKPAYAVRFWKERGLRPEPVPILEIIRRRAERYYRLPFETAGAVRLADSRKREALAPETPRERFTWVITSPPYYGMRTYIPDGWLRGWLVGGPAEPVYGSPHQLTHKGPEAFVADLNKVWRNAAEVCTEGAKMVIRFGGIRDRKAEPLELIKASLEGSGWRITAIRSAGSAKDGNRQADSFLRRRSESMLEYDIWAMRE